MSRGMTIADFVQQVLYAVYKVRLDVGFSDETPQAFHADTDRFKEVVMEANFVLNDLQKDQDWNWLRKKWHMGPVEVHPDGRIMEFYLPKDAYKVATGYNDAVRVHSPYSHGFFFEIPYTVARSGATKTTAMFSTGGQLDVPDNRMVAFVVGDVLTFNRPFYPERKGWELETDYIRYLEPLHICGADCEQPCPKAYEDIVLTEVTDPQFVVVKTAARRAEGDPSAADRVMSLTDESSKLLSAMRENDSAKTVPDTYGSIELGYTRIL